MVYKCECICEDCGRDWYGSPWGECRECGGIGMPCTGEDDHPPEDCPCGCGGDIECHLGGKTGAYLRRAGF